MEMENIFNSKAIEETF